MNIKRIINQNGKLIGYVVLIIIIILFAIKSLNSYYEKDERKKLEEINESVVNNQTSDTNTTQDTVKNNYITESNSIEKTMSSFVNFCNKKEIENAYKMLTEECKNAMFPTIEDFERIYINNVYNITREYELVEWAIDGNKATYQATLYGDLLATGNVDNLTQEFYTFIKDTNGNYKMNINNYIYGENRNIERTINNITIKIVNVDVYNEYEKAKIIVTNNRDTKISLTGNKYRKNIYLQNSKNTTYSSLNSRFDTEEIVMEPNSVQSFTIRFNKTYSPSNKSKYLVLSDVILDYENYLNSNDKNNYLNRTSLKMQYQ